MNITKWLASHPILAVWGLTIIALLLSFSGNSGNKGHDAKVAINAHVESGATAGHKDDAANATDGHGQETAQATTENAAPATGETHQVQAATSAPVNNNVASNQLQQQALAAAPSIPAPTANVATDTTQQAQNTANANGTTTATETTANADVATSSEQSLPEGDLTDKSTDDLLLMAREAYWNNGLDEAASIYLELIQREPNVIEHKGELGNVYWRQGFPEKSAALYAEIAIPMIDKGNAERVSNMIGFIGLFHPAKAAEINKHMQSAK